MSYEKYCELIDQIHTQYGLPDSELKYENCNLMLLDVPFTLAHGGQKHPNKLLVFCDFGEPPEEDRAAILAKVLEGNMELFAEDAGHFAINAETGHVLLMVKLSLEDIVTDSVMPVLMMYAGIATEWGKTHFLRPMELPDENGIFHPAYTANDPSTVTGAEPH
ncbi:MAG: CesT family type III secretion system chaperone [Pseudomonadota bacterium]